MAAGVVRRWTKVRAASTAAPAAAAQAGFTPIAEVRTNPARVQATVARTNTGTSGGSAAGGAWAPASRSVAKNRRKTAYSAPMATSHGSAISAAKRVKLSPLAANASRLVRLETGSSRDAVFDKWVQAYTCGLGRAPSRAAVANTTGVSSTTAASRLSTAVITEARTKTATSSRRGRPAALRAIHAPQARNSPSSSHNWASTSTAARNPITGPSRSATARAWSSEIAPIPSTTAAAGTAATASGQPHGRTSVQASTTSEQNDGQGFRQRGVQDQSLPEKRQARRFIEPDHQDRKQAKRCRIPDGHEQWAGTRPRSRTDLNGSGRPHG